MQPNLKRRFLEQAAGALATAARQLDLVQLNIDGRLAIYGAGPEWKAHEYVADVRVRSWPTPPGARYQVLEFMAKAGVQVPLMSRPTASSLHVMLGSVLIRRHGKTAALEVLERGQTTRFAPDEEYGSLVLTDTHTLIVISSTPFTK